MKSSPINITLPNVLQRLLNFLQKKSFIKFDRFYFQMVWVILFNCWNSAKKYLLLRTPNSFPRLLTRSLNTKFFFIHWKNLQHKLALNQYTIFSAKTTRPGNWVLHGYNHQTANKFTSLWAFRKIGSIRMISKFDLENALILERTMDCVYTIAAVLIALKTVKVILWNRADRNNNSIPYTENGTRTHTYPISPQVFDRVGFLIFRFVSL